MTVRVPIAEQRDPSYDIVIGRGLLGDLAGLVRSACPASRYAVITDSHVGKLYGAQVVARLRDATLPAQLFEFPAGEWNKTRETWALLCDRMIAAQFGRDAAVIALGGGVVGDVAGFVAATYLRGVPYVQVPTTLLAMIDSSIGGKTGVDVPAGKNLLGAFHQPRLVVADLDALGSLAPAQLAAGMAEAVKHICGLLEGYGLPVELPDTATVDGLVAAMQLDKKTRDGTVRFALPRAVGVMCGDRQAGWTVTAPERVVREVLGSGKESAQTR